MFGSRIDTQVLNHVCGDVATSPVLTGSVGSLQKACVCLADIRVVSSQQCFDQVFGRIWASFFNACIK